MPQWYQAFHLQLSNLKVLAQLKNCDKLYVRENAFLGIDLATPASTLKRSIWNWYYRGADRALVLHFLQQLCNYLMTASPHWIADLDTAPTSKYYLGALRELKLVLPRSIQGLAQLQITYKHDTWTVSQLRILSCHFCLLLQQVTDAVADDQTLNNWLNKQD